MWKIVTQSQTEHLGKFCTLSHAIKYKGGQFQLKQRIIDSQNGYEEGQKRALLISAAPEMLEALEAIRYSPYWEQLSPAKQDVALAAIQKARGCNG